jgi:small subunit ribosomal protein S20
LPARKAHRQSVTKSTRNHAILRNTRTTVSNARKALASGDKAVAETSVQAALSVLDKAVTRGILHKNNASRRKSRLALHLNRM